jgi:hypothetical protein
MPDRPLSIPVGDGAVSALLRKPPKARALFLLAHGAGAGMTHPFMQAMADALATRGIATLRSQFPYTEAGKRRPDPPAVLARTVEAAYARAVREARGKLPVFAGGKSMGGRVTSLLASRGALAELRGLIFLGFPLHAPKKPAKTRAEPLKTITAPMLFVQGARDALADLKLLRPIVRRLGATMHVVPEGDHSFAVPKRTGKTHAEILEEVADVVTRFVEQVLAR